MTQLTEYRARLVALEELFLRSALRVAGVDPNSVIDVQVLSVGRAHRPGMHLHQPVTTSSRINDMRAEATRRHPGPSRAVATLPMVDPETVAHELRRAVDDLGSVDAIVYGQTHGVFLDDLSVDPVLAAAPGLGVPLHRHPAWPPPSVRDAYYFGLPSRLADVLACASCGWHAECGILVARMVVAGTFERHPGLQLSVGVGDMTDGLPFSPAGADEWLTSDVDGLSRSVADAVLRHVHITISGYTTVPPLLCACLAAGPNTTCSQSTTRSRTTPPPRASCASRPKPVGSRTRRSRQRGKTVRGGHCYVCTTTT